MFLPGFQNIAEYQLKSKLLFNVFIDLTEYKADAHVQPGVCSINVLSDAELLLEELYTSIFSTRS